MEWRNEKKYILYVLPFPSVGSTASLDKLIAYRIMHREGDW